MENHTARLLVTRDALTQGATLMQVTTGPRGEILALAVDRTWHVRDRTEPLYRYTVTSWHDGSIRTLSIDSVTLRLTHVQPFDGGRLLLACARAGGIWEAENAMIVTADGTESQRFTLFDGIEDVQIDLANRVWVSYFDEGVFGGQELPAEGLVCFDANLVPTLRFNSLAIARGIPEMYDCYALNVAPTADTYAYYYGESAERYFPLVHLRDGQVADVWQITTVRGAHSVAVGTTHALFGGAYRHPERLALVDLATGETEDILAVDQDGRPIITTANEGSPLASVLIWGRGNCLYFLDRRGVWELAIPNH